MPCHHPLRPVTTTCSQDAAGPRAPLMYAIMTTPWPGLDLAALIGRTPLGPF